MLAVSSKDLDIYQGNDQIIDKIYQYYLRNSKHLKLRLKV